MEIQQAEFIKNIVDNMGDECRIIKDYSGRGMYGDTTAALSGDFSILQVAGAIIEDPDLCDEAREVGIDFSYRQDQLGMGYVYY